MAAGSTVASHRDPPASSPPRISAVLARVATSLMVACIAPAVLFSVTLVAYGISAAVIVALAWTCGATVWRWATNRPVSWLLLLTVFIMAVRTGFTLVTGNTFVYFVQPVFSDAAVAAIFLISLCSARPMVARLAGDFYPMDERLRARPRVRQLFRRLTLLWGLLIVAKGTITLWLLQALPVVDFVLIKNSAILLLTLSAVAATLWLSASVVRHEGMLAHAG